MVAMNMYQKVRDCKTKGYSIKRISKELQLDRKTVRKYCHMTESEFVQYCSDSYQRNRVFDQFRDEILSIYRINNGKVYGSLIYNVLEKKYGTLPGSKRTLRNYILSLKTR